MIIVNKNQFLQNAHFKKKANTKIKLLEKFIMSRNHATTLLHQDLLNKIEFIYFLTKKNFMQSIIHLHFPIIFCC